ncbi:MAG: Folate-binding protein YgfZ [Pseudomonadota bacterium]
MSLNLENKFILLSTSSMIKVEGDDRVPFLQGQLTQDIKLISHDKALFAGFCNPKGRVLAFMLCFEEHDSIHIQIDSSIAEPILRRLKMYVLRSKVSLNLLDNQFTCVGFVGSKPLLNQDIKLPENYLDIVRSHDVMIMRVGKNTERYQLMGDTIESWDNLNIFDGIPNIYPTTQEAFIPQSINMDLIDGINFKKGCYTGQEIVARTHYLGKVKRRMFRAFIESEDDLTPGEQIINEKKEAIGQLVRSAKEYGLRTNMLIELRVDQAHEALYIKNHAIEIMSEDKKIFD